MQIQRDYSDEPLYDPTSFDKEEEVPGPPSDEDLDMFKQQVAEWIKLDDQIRKLNIAVRERKVHQRALGSKIQDFMIRNNYDNLNTGQGRIRSKVRTVQQPLRITEVKKRLEELGHIELVEKVFSTSDRATVTKQSLTRVIPKVSLSLDL